MAVKKNSKNKSTHKSTAHIKQTIAAKTNENAAAHMAPHAKLADTKKPKNSITRKGLAIIMLGVLIVVILFGAIFYNVPYINNGNQQFNTFKSNFNNAKNVSIYINDNNSVAYPYMISCEAALIEELTGPTSAHRPANSISLYVLHNNSCVYNPGGLDSLLKNYTYTSSSACLSYGNLTPSISVGYSSQNSTKITNNKLTFVGDGAFLQQCGISYQIT